MPELRKVNHTIPLSKEEMAKFTAKRKMLGMTSQGLLRKLVLDFIKEDDDERKSSNN